MRSLRTLAVFVVTASLGFACKARTEQPNIVEPAPQNAKKTDDTADKDKEKADDEGWEPVPVGGMGGGPTDEATPAPAPKPVTKPKSNTPPAAPSAAPKPSTSAPPGWSLPVPPSGFTIPSAWPSGWSFPAPSSAPPAPSTTPSTNSGGWNFGQ